MAPRRIAGFVRAVAGGLAGLPSAALAAETMPNPYAGFEPPPFLQIVIFALIGLVLIAVIIRKWLEVALLALFAGACWVFYGPLHFNFWSSILLGWIALGVPAVIGNALLEARRKRLRRRD